MNRVRGSSRGEAPESGSAESNGATGADERAGAEDDHAAGARETARGGESATSPPRAREAPAASSPDTCERSPTPSPDSRRAGGVASAPSRQGDAPAEPERGPAEEPAPTPPRVRAASATDVGAVRARNEDFVAVGDLDAGELLAAGSDREVGAPHRGLLLFVCDGMGGAAGGDIASELAGRGLWAGMADAAATRDVAVLARHLRRAIRVANQLVYREARERGPRGMGTTISAAAVAGHTLVVGHVGDSRVYVDRGGALSRVTRDQSVVAALRGAGAIDEKEAERAPHRGTILQALGIREDVEVSLSIAELARGDRVLVCSDGVHGALDDGAIAEALASPGDREDVRAAADALLAGVRAAGAPDNASAVVAVVGGETLPPPGPEAELPFLELDPTGEGAAALSATSRVARRLAVRAGLRSDPVPDDGDIAATRQRLPAPLRDRAAGESAPAQTPPPGPATRALEARSRLGVTAYLAAGVVAIAVFALVWSIAL